MILGSEPGEAVDGGVGVGVDRPYRSERISGLRCVGGDGEGVEGERREPGPDRDWGRSALSTFSHKRRRFRKLFC